MSISLVMDRDGQAKSKITRVVEVVISWHFTPAGWVPEWRVDFIGFPDSFIYNYHRIPRGQILSLVILL